MANADAPRGFVARKMLDGSPYNGATVKATILAADGTATFIGDLVTMTGSAGAEGYPSVAQGAIADTDFFGVVASFDADPTNLESKHRLASTLRNVNVIPALDVIFSIQCDASSAITDIGNTTDIVVGTGDTVTGLSGMEADSTFGGGVNLLVVGLDERPDNEFGTNADLLVRINESAFRGTGTGV